MVTIDHSILFKSCTKCRGDMCHNEDQYGAYWQCLQCANLIEVDAAERTRCQELRARANPFR